MTEEENGTVTLSFSEHVTGCRLNKEAHHREGARWPDATVYTLEAWTTRLDAFLGHAGVSDITITPEAEEGLAIYYTPNGVDTPSDVLLYSIRYVPDGRAFSLPRLALGYYMTLAGIAALLLLVTLLIFWSREKVRIWLLRILFLPVSYLIADLCITRFHHVTYSMTRDFLWIVLAALLLYLALLFALNLYQLKKHR